MVQGTDTSDEDEEKGVTHSHTDEVIMTSSMFTDCVSLEHWRFYYSTINVLLSV